MRYRTYSYLLDAASWTGCSTDFLISCSDGVTLRHPDFTMWVEVPFVDADAGGECLLLWGSLSPQMAEALGIEVPDPWWKRLLRRLGVAHT